MAGGRVKGTGHGHGASTHSISCPTATLRESSEILQRTVVLRWSFGLNNKLLCAFLRNSHARALPTPSEALASSPSFLYGAMGLGHCVCIFPLN